MGIEDWALPFLFKIEFYFLLIIFYKYNSQFLILTTKCNYITFSKINYSTSIIVTPSGIFDVMPGLFFLFIITSKPLLPLNISV